MQIVIDPELLKTYGFYGGLLVAKMLFMSPYTVYHRRKKLASANPEDADFMGGKVSTDESVERVRRAHLNDMENVYLFFANASFYLMTEPEESVAVNLVRTFAAARFLHTFAYLNEVPQPTRAVAFLTGFGVNAFMAFCTIKHFWK